MSTASIQNNRKVILHEGKVIDGWQLLRACIITDIVPEIHTLALGNDQTVEDRATLAANRDEIRDYLEWEQAVEAVQGRIGFPPDEFMCLEYQRWLNQAAAQGE